MDGYSATRLIRAHEAESGARRVPIVGVTAYALKEDRDKCIAAGMDEYVMKPFRSEQLHAVIQRLTGK